MTDKRDFFTPDKVDDQVTRLSQYVRPTPSGDIAKANSPEQRLTQDLQAYYFLEQQEDIASLKNAWKRVSQSLPADQNSSQMTTSPLSKTILRFPQERSRMMHSHVSEDSRKRKISRILSLFAAALAIALLVGSLAVILNLSHNIGKTATTGTTAKATPTPSPGTVVYTTPASQFIGRLAWSHDSQRIASLSSGPDGNDSLQIWDATTGKHRIAFQLGTQHEWVYSLDWSPDGKYVALGTNKRILIINSSTGKIAHSYTQDVPVVSNGTSSMVPLSSRMPASGGFGYRSVKWSPDGKMLAASISFGSTGAIQIWDIQAGNVAYTLNMEPPFYVFGTLAWSYDGQYIAGQGWNPSSTSLLVAWKISSRQVVFQNNDLQIDSDGPVFWQAHTHNLATPGVLNNQNLVMRIWNITTKKLIKQLTGPTSDNVDLSPDGNHLAYTTLDGGKQAIAIMDLNTGKKIFEYTSKYQIGAMAWSPNGKYIVSVEATAKTNILTPVIRSGSAPYVAKVWIV